MEIKYGFTKMLIDEFENYISNIRVARTIISLQHHHTYSPNYALFSGNNHFDLQRGMKNYHVNNNGWANIGQHFTIFPDGAILTGRSLEQSPACITGQNQNAICIENLGNFDKGYDEMTPLQREAIIRATAAICQKFNIPVNTSGILYHHWFRLDNGSRNNGAGHNKSCPGTNFFGGNKVEDCERNFIPRVREIRHSRIAEVQLPERYVSVTANTLNIRSKPVGTSEKTKDREPVQFGAVLRVYAQKDGWLKISNSKEHWVYGGFTTNVERATVTCDILNVRNAPDLNALKIGSLNKGAEVFIYEHQNDWCRIGVSQKWVNKKYLYV